MTDDLRTRIIAVLEANEGSLADAADAVIRELGLKREDWNEGYSDRYRHVTGWRS